jgi:hypothetical protein
MEPSSAIRAARYTAPETASILNLTKKSRPGAAGPAGMARAGLPGPVQSASFQNNYEGHIFSQAFCRIVL